MPLSPEAKARLRQESEEIRQQMAQAQASGGRRSDWSRYIYLGGTKNPLIPPGGSVIGRLLPRWDILQKFTRNAKGDIVQNPNYKVEEEQISVKAFEHWYFDFQGRQVRDWCRKCLGEEEPCPLDETSVALYKSGTEADQAEAKSLRRKVVFLYNWLTRKRYDPEKKVYVDAQYTTEGKPDIRILPVTTTIHVAINDIMVGGPAGEEFAKGEIFSVDDKEGHDIQIIRPAKQGDEYKVTCASSPSRLYVKTDTRWAGWIALLHDLPAEIAPDKILSYAALYKKLNGKDPDPERAVSLPSGNPSFGQPMFDNVPEPEGFPDFAGPEGAVSGGNGADFPEDQPPASVEDYGFLGDQIAMPAEAEPKLPPTPTRTPQRAATPQTPPPGNSGRRRGR